MLLPYSGHLKHTDLENTKIRLDNNKQWTEKENYKTLLLCHIIVRMKECHFCQKSTSKRKYQS